MATDDRTTRLSGRILAGSVDSKHYIVDEPIADVEQAVSLGLIPPGAPGHCFGIPGPETGYDERDPMCQACYESDRCAEATLRFINSRLIRAQAENSNAENECLFVLPESFVVLDAGIRSLGNVVKFTRRNSIVYGYKGKKVVSIVPPIAKDAVTMMFHNCRIMDLKDPKKRLWYGDKRHPEKPFLFVADKQIRYAIWLAGQVYSKLRREVELVDKERVTNVRIDDARGLVRRVAATALVGEVEGRPARQTGSRTGSHRVKEAARAIRSDPRLRLGPPESGRS